MVWRGGRGVEGWRGGGVVVEGGDKGGGGGGVHSICMYSCICWKMAATRKRMTGLYPLNFCGGMETTTVALFLALQVDTTYNMNI